MKIFKWISYAILLCVSAALASSCEETKSYAQLRDEEDAAVKKYLEGQTVINKIPEDTVFEMGEDAPYYKLDEDGYVYMQVLSVSEDGEMAKYNETIFFRYSRINLLTWAAGGEQVPMGNDNDLGQAYFFNFQNTVLNSTSQYGIGIQQPLYYIKVPCKVNLIVKSKVGSNSDLTSVTPYLYTIRYNPSSI